MTLAPSPEAVLTVQAPGTVTLEAGGVGEARIAVVVADGYHVQASPAKSEFLIPLRLQLRAKGGIRPKTPVYPPGQPYSLEGTSTELMTYEGAFEISVPLEAGEAARPGDHMLKGTLSYQACDARTCLFPASVKVAVSVRVVAEQSAESAGA
jgi:hypothetical protein